VEHIAPVRIDARQQHAEAGHDDKDEQRNDGLKDAHRAALGVDEQNEEAVNGGEQHAGPERQGGEEAGRRGLVHAPAVARGVLTD
jgi:hypothetical protein